MSDWIRDNLSHGFPQGGIASAPRVQSIAHEDTEAAALPDHVRDYLSLSIAPNSRRAYASDLRRFSRWGGSLPSDAAVIATYLADHACTHSASTLRRWTASISRAHIAGGFRDPTKDEPARSTLRGIVRSHGQRSSCATPLLRDDLFAALDFIGTSIRDKRDRSLLLLGFGGGFRRSELIGIDIRDITFARRGVIIFLRQSKTDQTGVGREVAIPFGRLRHCPVAALENWLSASKASDGPLYRPVSKNGRVLEKRLSGGAVSNIVKQRILPLGFDVDRYSGHSLRAGFATSAAQAGVSSWRIRQQTGHTSDAMLAKYIRISELFIDNAAGALL